MDAISCRHCKIPFVPSHPNTRLCSDTCKIDRNKYLCKKWDRKPKNKAERKVYNAKLWAEDKDYYRNRSFKERYGITLAEARENLAQFQGGKCAVCVEPIDLDAPGINALNKAHMDHCHDTGENRGILCRECNWMLGNGKDDPVRLRAGAEYLERWADFLARKHHVK